MHMTQTLSTVLRRVALAATLAMGSSLASASVIHVDVNSSDFGVATGYVDMQFSATDGVPLQTALVTNLAGFDPAAFIDSWGLTPTAGGYLFRNDTSNDLFHAVNFGGVLSFDLTFAGAIDPLSSYVSHFVVSAFDEAFAPLGHYDPARGSLADFSWTPATQAGVDGNIGVNITDAAVTFIPEPADTLLLGGGLAIMALMLRRRVGARRSGGTVQALPA